MANNKLTCPGCGAHLSAVWQAFTEGHPCPSCGDDLNGVQITTSTWRPMRQW